jgi:hypothetical protein
MANERFFSVRHPSAHATNKKHAILIASAVATSWKIPSEWEGQLVAILPIGTGILYSVTETAKTINPAAVSDPNGVMSDVAGFPIVDGGVMDRALNGKWLNWAPMAGGAGTVFAYVSTEQTAP